MPELPEVETVRRGLDRALAGRRITSVAVTGRRSVRRQSIPSFKKDLVAKEIMRIGRHGKYLLGELSDQSILVMHLRMSGRLCVADTTDPVVRHTHITIGFDDGSALRFVDPRTFGEMFVAKNTDAGLPAELLHLGVDPIATTIDAPMLAGVMARRTTALKTLLLDQRAIAGIGNIYADEICFLSGIRPDRRCNDVTADELPAIATAITEVLNAAIALGGSSLPDTAYRDAFGELGSYQDHHNVYAKTNSPCPECATPIVGIRIAGRSAHFCPRCQV